MLRLELPYTNVLESSGNMHADKSSTCHARRLSVEETSAVTIHSSNKMPSIRRTTAGTMIPRQKGPLTEKLGVRPASSTAVEEPADVGLLDSERKDVGRSWPSPTMVHPHLIAPSGI